jgi:hypothetical protein
VSSARAAIDPDLTLAVWVTADPDLRLARGLTRDGVALRPQWLRWMGQEAAHFAADATAERADLVVDGTPAAGGPAAGVADEVQTGYVPLVDRRWTRRTAGGTIARGAGARPRAGNGEGSQ